MSQIKYEKELAIHFKDFDFAGFSEKKILSYRWVFKDINDSRNFCPPYIKDPGREIEVPTGFALSLFETKEAGINRLKKLTNNKPFLFKKLGTHIAEGVIENSSGVCCDPNKFQHFDLFEYVDIDLKANFTILEQIA